MYKVYTSTFTGATGDLKPLDYTRMVRVWNLAPELRHIKLAKYKPGFSKCDVCEQYKTKCKKQLSEAQRQDLDDRQIKHIEEFMSEKYAYYAARAKCIAHPEQCMSVIMDAMDQRKTRVPYFTNPPKSVANEYTLKTKLFGATVHGHGTYFYWCTSQLSHDSNLTIEVLRRTLLKYESEKGKLPPTLYLQLDNGPDQKSKQFLTFLAYLVQMKVFDTIKVSYLIVGHTHEDIDQKFSRIGRYIRRTLCTIWSIPSFVEAINHSFTKKEGASPKCVEQIQWCHNTSSLTNFSDKHLARFALPEKSGDNVHYFLFKRNKKGSAVMQYKMKRCSNAMWPRKYNPGDSYISSRYGKGIVTSCDPSKDDISKEKYWNNTVKFTKPDGSSEEVIFTTRAAKCRITIFPAEDVSLPTDFPIADLAGTFAETLGDQKAGIQNILDKLNVYSEDPSVPESWEMFWQSCPKGAKVSPDNFQKFNLPKIQAEPKNTVIKKRKHSRMDDGNRLIGVVTHSKFTKKQRQLAGAKAAALQTETNGLPRVSKGQFVVVEDSQHARGAAREAGRKLGSSAMERCPLNSKSGYTERCTHTKK